MVTRLFYFILLQNRRKTEKFSGRVADDFDSMHIRLKMAVVLVRVHTGVRQLFSTSEVNLRTGTVN